MKVIILAGGLGTRISEETSDKPKPMVLVDGKPILWHLMNIFAQQGLTDFIVATGYKHETIEDWIANSDFSWSIEVLFTGLNTQTGGRIAKVMKKIPSESVIVTYGDGLGNIDINSLLAFHKSHGKLATVTAVHPPARFGHLELLGNSVSHFGEKNQSDVGWINGGFFVLEPTVSRYIHGDSEAFEIGALNRLTKESELMAYKHESFWQPMDTLREKLELELLAKSELPPWLNFAESR